MYAYENFASTTPELIRVRRIDFCNYNGIITVASRSRSGWNPASRLASLSRQRAQRGCQAESHAGNKFMLSRLGVDFLNHDK